MSFQNGVSTSNLRYDPQTLQAIYANIPGLSAQQIAQAQADPGYGKNGKGGFDLSDVYTRPQAQFSTDLANTNSALHQPDTDPMGTILNYAAPALIAAGTGGLAGPALAGALGPMFGSLATGALTGLTSSGLTGGNVGRGVLNGVLGAGLGQIGNLGKSATYGLTDAFGVPLPIARGLVGAGTGAIGGALTGQGAGQGALMGGLTGAASGMAQGSNLPSSLTNPVLAALPGIISGNPGRALGGALGTFSPTLGMMGGAALSALIGSGNRSQPPITATNPSPPQMSAQPVPQTMQANARPMPGGLSTPPPPIVNPPAPIVNQAQPIVNQTAPNNAAAPQSGLQPVAPSRQQIQPQNLNYYTYGSGPEASFFKS